MTEIPEDIRKAAATSLRLAITTARAKNADAAIDIIGAAIFAERERCSQIAFNHEIGLAEYPSEVAEQYYQGGSLDMALGIASAIMASAHPHSPTETDRSAK